MGKKKIKHLGKKRRKNKSIGGFIKKTIILLGTFISLITFIYLDKHIKELYKGVNIEESAIEFYIDMADEIGNKEDVKAIEYAVNSGVNGIFTAHGSDLEQIRENPILKQLILNGYIDRVLLLDNMRNIHLVYEKQTKRKVS